MDYQIVVLSGDVVFARMLELEFSNLQISVLATSELKYEDCADVLILDLDSASAPSPEQYGKMIGFSRHPAIASPDARSCSMILRRPFQMNSLRQEIFALLEREWMGTAKGGSRRTAPERRQIALNEESEKLICDGCEISLTGKEFAVLKLLLEHRGNAISKQLLNDVIGCAGEGNEAEVYVCYLRRKTDGLPNGRLIQTVRGKGYQIL